MSQTSANPNPILSTTRDTRDAAGFTYDLMSKLGLRFQIHDTRHGYAGKSAMRIANIIGQFMELEDDLRKVQKYLLGQVMSECHESSPEPLGVSEGGEENTVGDMI